MEQGESRDVKRQAKVGMVVRLYAYMYASTCLRVYTRLGVRASQKNGMGSITRLFFYLALGFGYGFFEILGVKHVVGGLHRAREIAQKRKTAWHWSNRTQAGV